MKYVCAVVLMLVMVTGCENGVNDEDVVEAAGAVAVTKCNEVAFKCRNRQFIVDENKTYKNLPHVGHC